MATQKQLKALADGRKKLTAKRKKTVKKGLNGAKCSYHVSDNVLPICSNNRKEFKQMLYDYAEQHPTKKVGGCAIMTHSNGYVEVMYSFKIENGIVIFDPRVGNKKFLNGTANKGRAPRVKTMTIAEGKRWHISEYPNFGKTGNVTGMRKLYYGKMALLVKCGDYIYNVTTAPEIYDAAK
ncbi:MAG: hypothetical protein IKR17_01045 [Bacteroidales bacterium]|nr:hypothetical protein [Bacteroidales bacterium]